MKKNILWEGIEYHSLENCLIIANSKGALITSVAIGEYHRKIFRVDYEICTNKNWEVVSFKITIILNSTTKRLKFEANGKGAWKTNGKIQKKLEGCIDVDISLTPFTNSLPLNRLQLKKGQEQVIKVLYVDVFERKVKPVLQKYTRLSGSVYKFENVPNDFEAKIKVDANGFVIGYPGLFTR